MEEREVDYLLVPLGVLVLGIYHVWLLFTIIRHPSHTVIGLNAQSRYQWVLSIMAVSILFLSFSLFITSHILRFSMDY